MTTKPTSYEITRKKTSKPDGPMRVIMSAPPAEGGTDAGLAAGGTFYFEPGQKQVVQADLAIAFMADAFHQEHFDIDPDVPKKVMKEAVAAEDARTEPVDGPDAPAVPPVPTAQTVSATIPASTKKTTTTTPTTTKK